MRKSLLSVGKCRFLLTSVSAGNDALVTSLFYRKYHIECSPADWNKGRDAQFPESRFALVKKKTLNLFAINLL